MNDSRAEKTSIVCNYCRRNIADIIIEHIQDLQTPTNPTCVRGTRALTVKGLWCKVLYSFSTHRVLKYNIL